GNVRTGPRPGGDDEVELPVGGPEAGRTPDVSDRHPDDGDVVAGADRAGRDGLGDLERAIAVPEQPIDVPRVCAAGDEVAFAVAVDVSQQGIGCGLPAGEGPSELERPITVA